MTGMRSTVGIRPLATVALGIIVLVTACGGSASTAPSAAPGQSNVTGSTPPPGATGVPATSGGTSKGDLAFGGATGALDALDSYEYRVEIATSKTTASVATQTRTVMSGVVVNRPAKASNQLQEEFDASGKVTSSTGIRIIGSNAWVQNGSTNPWSAIPAAQADLFAQSLAAFRPEKLFGVYFASLGGSFSTVGSETKNGVSTIHYKGDDTIGSMLGAIAGFQGTWTSDVWIAKDGGFLVHSEASGKSSGTDASTFLIVVDVTKPNAAGPIAPPS